MGKNKDQVEEKDSKGQANPSPSYENAFSVVDKREKEEVSAEDNAS